MKYLVLIIFLLVGSILKAQNTEFTVDCGRDTSFCVGLYIDTFNIGTHVELTNGVEPYKYFWTCKPIRVSDNLLFTASIYLNDTSLANPFLKGFGVKNEPWAFYLTVIDGFGNIASDSISVNCSMFTYHAKQYDFDLQYGDSIQFYDDIFVGGGIPPVKYYWTPSIGLDDSTRINAWCKPEQPTGYYQYIIDSVGCVSEINSAYNISLYSTAINNLKAKPEDLLNLKHKGERLVFNNPLNKRANLSFYTLDGKKIYATKTNNSFYDISALRINGCMIICVLSMENITSVIKIH